MQSMKKCPGMDKIRDLGNAFIKRIDRLMKGCSEGRNLFGRYITGSLKEKTRAKRAGTTQPVKSIIQDSMNVCNVPIKTTVVPC